MDEHFEWTGERLTTSKTNEIAVHHLHRYAIALEFSKGKVVLDIASGEGYGTNLLAKNAKEAIGVDVSESVIEHAQKKYKSDNLSFKVGSTSSIPLEDNSVDLFVSFETIEHHDEHEKMMEEICRVLKDDGILIISSPNKKYYTDATGFNNQFHVKELYKEEFEALLNKNFEHFVSLDQQIVYGSVFSVADNYKTAFTQYSGDFDAIEKDNHVTESKYTLSIASKQPLDLNKVGLSSFFRSDELLQTIMNKDLEVYNSKTYKIGNMIVSPFRALKKIFK